MKRIQQFIHPIPPQQEETIVCFTRFISTEEHLLQNLYIYIYITTVSLVDNGCLGHPGASTSKASPQINIPLSWLAVPCNPAMSPHTRPKHLSH
jgi:hypothetical protein